MINLTEYQSDGIDTPEWSIGRATYAHPLHLWNKSSGKLTDLTTRFSFSIKTFDDQASKGGGLAFFLVPYNLSFPFPADEFVSVASFGLTNYDSLNTNSRNQFVAVEFDPYFSSNWDPPKEDGRPDHVGIDINSVRSSATTHWWRGTDDVHVSIDYNSESMNLMVVFTSFRDDNDSLSYMVDLRRYLPEFVSVGLTAANKNLSAQHNIHSWSFTSTLQPLNVNIGAQPPAPTPPGGPTDMPSKSNAPTTVTRENSKSKTGLVIGLSVSLSFILVLVLLASYIFWNRSKRTRKGTKRPSELSIICNEVRQDTSPVQFTYNDLKEATNNFAKDNKLGQGGSGSVCKGCLNRKNELIAVKRISSNSTQGIREYETEVKIISTLRHRSLVKLLGWCHEKKQELLLVYEYMPNGSLDFHLFSKVSLLSWEIRMKIAKGLASALLYLHKMWEHCVLHRDIKSANIMLDEHFNVKLGDFGLSQMVDHLKGSKTSVNVVGTRGYMAPEYMYTCIASKETDVFSFGVVVLEIATGRRAIHNTEQGPVNLVERVWSLYGTGKVLEAVDPRLGSDFNKLEMSRLMTLGLWCAHPDGRSQPSISEVARVLDCEAPLPDLPSRMPSAIGTPFYGSSRPLLSVMESLQRSETFSGVSSSMSSTT